jgi:pimeloyl-ACP methyl ester carboxylesterase
VALDLTERFEWKGRQIAWSKAGNGPPVVFCHGTPFSSIVWRPFAEALSQDFAVYLWDMPGYGRSSKSPDHPVDFDSQARCFAALLQHWQLDRPHIVAHDFGGAVSLRANLFYDMSYVSLMLIDVVAIPPSGSPFFRFVQQHSAIMAGLPAYIHEAIVRRYIQGASHRPLRDDDVEVLVRPWLGSEGQPAFYRQIVDYDERYLVDNEQRLHHLRIPVRVLWGAEDAWIPTEIGDKLARLIPNATNGIAPGAGHLIHYDAPIRLADELRRWLTHVNLTAERVIRPGA